MKKILLILMSLLLFIPTFVNAEDNEAPEITGVEIVSDSTEDGYDTEAPIFDIIDTENTVKTVKSGFGIAVYVKDKLSDVTEVYAEVTKPNGATETIQLGSKDQTYYWKLLDLTNNDIGIWTLNKVIAVDSAQNKAEANFQNYKIYILPDNYSSYDNGRTQIVTDTHQIFKINFSKEMDSDTLVKNNFTILERSSYFEAGSNMYSEQEIKEITDFEVAISEDKKSVFIKNSAPYERFNKNDNRYREYYLIINDNLLDKDGNKLKNPMFVKFQAGFKN